MDSLPCASQFYARIIDEARENIQRLEQSISDMTPIFQKELARETTEKDYKWWESIAKNPTTLDWECILSDTKTSSTDFRKYLPLYGLSGGTLWLDVVGQRAITFKVHTERYDVLPLYAELMHSMAPFMKPRLTGTVDWALSRQHRITLNQGTGLVSLTVGRNDSSTYTSLLDALTDYHMHHAKSMFES